MKKIYLFALTTIVAVSFAACGGTTENKPANANASNANAVKPVAAAPTKEALLELDKKATEAFLKGDSAHFEGMLSDKFVSYNNGQRSDKAGEIAMVKSVKCETKSWSLDDPQMAKINDDTYVVAYKGTYDGSCTWDGKTEKMPSSMRAASVWVRNGEKWQGLFHNETPIIDPKAPPPASAKKDEAKKAEPKKDDKAAANSNTAAATAPAKPTPSANTDALVKIHQAGWEAWKAKDAKWFNDNMTAGFSFVDPMGGWYSTKADTIKLWTETMKCEGVTKVSVTDGFSTAVTPTMEILTLKGTADGTCDGQKNGSLFSSAVYVKEGDAWKLAFMFESPAM